jgi:hypothetical protein
LTSKILFFNPRKERRMKKKRVEEGGRDRSGGRLTIEGWAVGGGVAKGLRVVAPITVIRRQ